MNPILADIYSTVVPSMPYIIAAYALVWVALLVYVGAVVRGLKRTEAQMAVLEEEVARRMASASDGQSADWQSANPDCSFSTRGLS